MVVPGDGRVSRSTEVTSLDNARPLCWACAVRRGKDSRIAVGRSFACKCSVLLCFRPIFGGWLTPQPSRLCSVLPCVSSHLISTPSLLASLAGWACVAVSPGPTLVLSRLILPCLVLSWRSALNTGQECELLMLEGTFSIVYRAMEYFTPVEVMEQQQSVVVVGMDGVVGTMEFC